MKKETMDRDTFDLWWDQKMDKAHTEGNVPHGFQYLTTPGSVDTIHVHDLLAALDRGLRALLKHHALSPHQAMIHGRILPLSTDPYEKEEAGE